MNIKEYEEAKARLTEVECEAVSLYDELDVLQEEREELEAAIEKYEAEQAALDE